MARLASALALGLSSSVALAAPIVGPPTKDANGVLHYPVTSSFQTNQPNDLRVLLPASFGVGQRRFLYALPVETGTASAFGDPVATVRALGVVDAQHWILVVPAFSQLPWYADHPSDPSIRQESYFAQDVLSAVETLYPETAENAGPPRRVLLGFSKSGVGAVSLTLRHATTFDAAAAWDAPLAKTDVNQLPGALPIFGTQANYDTYAIPSVLPAHAQEFQGTPRLWLGGWSGWHADMIAAHNQMASLGIAHAWVDGPQVAHTWTSGWVKGAIDFLDQAAPASSFDAGADAGVDGAAEAGSEARTDGGGLPDASTDAGVPDAGANSSPSSTGATDGSHCESAGRSGRSSWPATLLVGVVLGCFVRRRSKSRARRAEASCTAPSTAVLGRHVPIARLFLHQD